MRNLHYKPFGYRLNEKTINEIREIKIAANKSYNLVFVELIKLYKKSKKFQKQTKSSESIEE